MSYADRVVLGKGTPYASAIDTQKFLENNDDRIGMWQGATITVGDISSPSTTVTVQLLDHAGKPITQSAWVTFITMNSAGTAFASVGGSTGFAIDGGSTAFMDADLAKLVFDAVSDDNGQIVLDYTDVTSPELTVKLGVVTPQGKVIVSAGLASA